MEKVQPNNNKYRVGVQPNVILNSLALKTKNIQKGAKVILGDYSKELDEVQQKITQCPTY